MHIHNTCNKVVFFQIAIQDVGHFMPSENAQCPRIVAHLGELTWKLHPAGITKVNKVDDLDCRLFLSLKII